MLTLLLFIASFFGENGQIQIETCNDVEFIYTVDSLLNRGIHNLTLNSAINNNYSTDECKIKFYAYLFDKIFDSGLDLYSRLKPGIRDNTIIWTDDYVETIPSTVVDSSSMKIRAFLNFVQTKKAFERNFNNKHDNEYYNSAVINIIKYGIFTHPDKVESFLKFEYEKITKEKFYEDMRYYHLKK